VKSLSHNIELLELVPDAPPGLEIRLARQVDLGRLVELVTLKEGVTPRSPHAQMAITEARAHGMLRHRSVIEVYSLEVTESAVAIEREAAQGERLQAVLGRLSLEERLGILAELCQAIAHAHERRVLHGDLSLERIVVASSGVVKLAGFRLPLAAGVDTCPSDAIVGAGLRVPEVRVGAPYGVLAEVYGFGCLAFEVLTGKPWRDETSPRMTTPVFPPSLLLPPHVEEVLALCLARVPAQRPESLRAVHERLDPKLASRATPRERSISPSSVRNFALLGAAALALLVLGLGAGYFGASRVGTPPRRLSVVPLDADPAQEGARIRVVARPWAHVSVDGKFHDTTPFAAPIAVSPGVHTIRLEHPEAAPEERTVQVGAGQTALVDVALRLLRPVILDREVERPVETTP
jgi:serine/threonine protein kinase